MATAQPPTTCATTRCDNRPPSDPCFRNLDRTIIALDERPPAPSRWALRLQKRVIERRQPSSLGREQQRRAL
jgi:hypothetical protein